MHCVYLALRVRKFCVEDFMRYIYILCLLKCMLKCVLLFFVFVFVVIVCTAQ